MKDTFRSLTDAEIDAMLNDTGKVVVAAELHDFGALMQAAERIGFRPPELDETLAQYAEALAKAVA